MAAYHKDSLESFRLSPLHLSRGNHHLITPYILLFNLLLIISYLEGSVIRGASALIAADPLNRFSNGSPSLIHVARDSDTVTGRVVCKQMMPKDERIID